MNLLIVTCVSFPIACQGTDLPDVLQDFGGNQGSSPWHYPLSIRKPRRVEVQPLFGSIAGIWWKGKHMNRKGWFALVNSVITANTTTTRCVDNFFGPKTKETTTTGGKYLVNWKRICAPACYEGLGTKNIQMFGHALQLRWEWLRWSDNDNPWKGTPPPYDKTDKDLFAESLWIMETRRDSSTIDGLIGISWHDHPRSLFSSNPRIVQVANTPSTSSSNKGWAEEAWGHFCCLCRLTYLEERGRHIYHDFIMTAEAREVSMFCWQTILQNCWRNCWIETDQTRKYRFYYESL